MKIQVSVVLIFIISSLCNNATSAQALNKSDFPKDLAGIYTMELNDAVVKWVSYTNQKKGNEFRKIKVVFASSGPQTPSKPMGPLVIGRDTLVNKEEITAESQYTIAGHKASIKNKNGLSSRIEINCEHGNLVIHGFRYQSQEEFEAIATQLVSVLNL